MRRDRQDLSPLQRPAQGQALVEYVLIITLVAFAFGVALAATGPVIGNVFSNSVRDLLRQTQVGEIPDREEFWETVTYAFENPPREKPQITNTPALPTSQPTAGPSPTTVPSSTASPESPTPLPTMTATEADITHVAPWRDTVDDADWWRMDANINLGGHGQTDPKYNWKTEYFNNTNLSGAPMRTFGGIKTWPRIEFAYNSTPPFGGGPINGYSARFTRIIELQAPRMLKFAAVANNGVRIKLNGTNIPLKNGALTAPFGTDDGTTVWVGFANANAGENTVIVEYVQSDITGETEAKLAVDIQAGGPNPNDTAINGGPGAQCNWGQSDTRASTATWTNPNTNGNNANTELHMFEEYVGGDIPNKTRCFLELRGAVHIPAEWTGAELSFWDVWDFSAAGSRAYLEVAQYVPLIEPSTGNMTLDRGAVQWKNVPLHANTTANYNWSHTKIDLTKHINFAALGPERLITFRFVMENDANNSTRRWYVDDIAVTKLEPRILPVKKKWDLDDLSNDWGAANSVYNEFIFTGGTSNAGNISGTRLVGNNKFGPSGQSLHDSVGPNDSGAEVAGEPGSFTDYKRHLEAPDSAEFPMMRAHTIEINGYIDLTNVPASDTEGNTGPPVLSFYYGYDLGNFTGLQVEYTTDSYDKPAGDVKWTPFVDGKLRAVTASAPGDGRVKRTSLVEHQVSLKALPNNPQRIRIRWAMYVQKKADPRFDGFWLDEIRLGREEAPKWVDYPFYDDAQSFTINNWRFVGQWSVTDETGRQSPSEQGDDGNFKRRSWSSNPGGRYSDGESTWMEQRYPVDLFNDTPNKLWADPAKTGPNNTYGKAAEKPVLTFYHWRDLGTVDSFRVEWKRIDEAETAWRTLWVYNHGMQTDSASRNARTAQQLGWEPVTVDLYPLMNEIKTGQPNADLRDDDIVIRFVLVADGAANGRGLYIDDVRFKERDETTWKLWPEDETRANPAGGPSLGKGSGNFFIADADVNSTLRGWWEEWSNGGGWDPVAFEKRFGALAFHDSVGQSSLDAQKQLGAPSGHLGTELGDPQFYTLADTFNVLQLNTIIDLRAVDATNEAPTLYFWSRHHIGNGAKLLVQISEDMSATMTDAAIDSEMNKRCENQPLVQCYEQNRGWTKWVTVPEWPRLSTGESRWYGWTRGQVDLRPWAHNYDTKKAGKRIRIRFVLDNLDATNTYDGWYLDNITIEYRNPPPRTTIIKNATFDDRARNLNNWVTEGKWGLAPDVYQGGGGGPAYLGLWDVSWWECTNCGSGGKKFNVGADQFLANPPRNPDKGSKPPVASTIPPMDTIALAYGSGSPVPGWTKKDKLVARFELNTGVVGAGSLAPGNRSFLVTADDGVRLKVEEIVNGVPQVGPIEWNVINGWVDQGGVSYTGSFDFMFGKEYLITLEYYENTGSGSIVMSIGDGRYSFTDSPKKVVSEKDVPPIPYSNTSLLMNGVIDMTGLAATEYVLMEYQNMYKLAKDEFATVEVSNNGGFDWTRNNLTDSVVIGGNTIVDKSKFSSTRWDNSMKTNNWQVRLNNLTAYKGQIIMVRFRLDRQIVWCMRLKNSNESSGEASQACRDEDTSKVKALDRYNSMFYNGWWITPIVIRKF